jgi:hypothetical protein
MRFFSEFFVNLSCKLQGAARQLLKPRFKSTTTGCNSKCRTCFGFRLRQISNSTFKLAAMH